MELLEIINAAGGISAIASQVGVSESQAQAGIAALLPAVLGGFKQHASANNGLAGLTSLLQSVGGTALLENVVGPAATNVQAGNDLLGQLFGSKEVSRSVADHAANSSGLSADALKKMLPLLAMVVSGVMASKAGQGAPGAGALGGLGGLLSGALTGTKTGQTPGGLASLLDLDGDGNPLDDIAGLAGKLFGR